jgi:hypothetical protein
MPPRMLAYGNAIMSEVGVIADDEGGVLVLRDSGKGIGIPLHEDIIFLEEGFNVGALADADKAMGGVLENLDTKTIMECSHILHQE